MPRPNPNQLIDRNTVLCHVRSLLSKDHFSQEDTARVSGLLGLAEKLPNPNGETFRIDRESPELRAFDRWVRSGRESRDLGIGSPTQSTATSDLVSQGFLRQLAVALKQIDPFFDAAAVNHIETGNGAPIILPVFDDTATAAIKANEDQQDQGPDDPGLQAVALGPAPTYRSGILPISNELLTDSGIDMSSILAAAFAIRLQRGAGPDLVTSLLGSALLGRTAAGSAENTGGAETGGTSIGWTDLIQLRKSVNPAYRQSEKCAWLMNDDTLSALDGIIDKSGRPIFHPQFDADGNRTLLGFPVRISPSMPDIGLSAKPVAFGDMGYFAVRIVQGATQMYRLVEKFAEYGKVAFRAQMRVNGALLGVTASESPVKLLQNAAA